MKFNVQLEIVVEAENEDTVRDLINSMVLEHEIPTDRFAVTQDEFIVYSEVQDISAEVE